MLEFLKNYWQEGVLLVSLLISCILAAVKKPVSSSFESDIKASLSLLIPQWINAVEQPGHGVDKKNEVIIRAIKFITCRYGRALDDIELSSWTATVSTLIEANLSTPTAKGKEN